MKNVCFLIGSLNSSGGTERVTSLIANALDKEKYNIQILSLFDGKNPFFELNKNISFHELNDKKISMKKNYFSTILKIRNFVIKKNIHTLIVVDSISCVFTVPALFGLKIKHICWEHFNFNVDLGVYFRRLGRKWAAKYCDYIVTLTERDKILWERGLSKISAKIFPISNPTPYENIENYPSLEFKTILSLGRLTHQKGYDMLIDAWAKVCKENKDWTLRIVGSGEDEIALKRQAEELNIVNRIDFVPAAKNVEQYYRTSSFYCMSSRFEGLPMVLLEAQAFGIPLIAFDCITGPSDIIENGLNGFLVKDRDVKGLVDNIIKSISCDKDLYSELVFNSLLNSRNYSIESIINRWKVIV